MDLVYPSGLDVLSFVLERLWLPRSSESPIKARCLFKPPVERRKLYVSTD